MEGGEMECAVHKLVADVALYAEGCVVFVKYRDTSKYDGQAGWFLPDDYLAHAEHPREAAARIVREQLGVQPPELELADIESFDGGAWHLIFHFSGRLPQAAEVSRGANVAAAEWFPLEALPPADEVAHGGWGLETLAKIGNEQEKK